MRGGVGALGIPGQQGLSEKWKGSAYFCPEGRTKTMKLADCSIRGCRLEVLFENEWGTVCSGGIGAETAETLCKALGFTLGGKVVSQYGGGKGEIWLDEVSCQGEEGDIGDCKHAPWGKVSCQHGDDVGLCCFGGKPDGDIGQRVGPSSFPRCPSINTADMRLVDCNKEVCRLEVRYNNTWGTVCDNGFTDTNAATLCHFMGYPHGVFKEMCATEGRLGSCQPNLHGAGPIWLDDVVCLGFERDLDGCRHRPWGDHRCTHRQDVGICCSGDRGEVVAPSPCRHGELDYRFNENLDSSTGGPDLAAPWGGRFDGVNGYRFIEGQGLGCDPSGCLSAGTYTVYLDVKLDQTIGERKLVHSNGWDDAGVYIVDGRLSVLPESASLTCEQKILPNKFIQYVVSRGLNGEIRIYIDGALCASHIPSDYDFLALNPHEIMLLADTGLKNPSGFVKRIRLFNKALPEDDVAKMCNCRLTIRDKPCERHIEMNAALSGIKYSSVKEPTWHHCAWEGELCECHGVVRFGNNGAFKTEHSAKSIECSDQVFGDPLWGVRKYCECKPKAFPGSGYSAGRMNSPQAWSAKESAAGQWMQMDTGSVQSISGLVTQGRRDQDEWVTSYQVQVSSDSKDWIDVGCGRVWEANTDRNSKVHNYFHEPVHARYIRVLPLTWHGYLSMRAGILVCERPCLDGELNYMFPLSFISTTQGPALDPAWGEGDFDDVELKGKMTTVYKFAEGEGLELDQQRCLKGSLAWTIIVDAKLESADGYKRILGSQGWGDYGLYVNERLMLIPRNSHMVCSERIRTTKFYKFGISRDEKGEIKLYVNGGLCASGSPPYKNHFQLNPSNIMIMRDEADENTAGYLKNIHIWNKALSDKEMQSVCECTLPDDGEKCMYTVVFNAPSARAMYSSTRNKDPVGVGNGRGRLGSKQAWSSAILNTRQYVQLDTGFEQSISGVVTQGRRDQDEWVTSFSVQVSSDGVDWKDIGCGIEFDGNTDRNTKVKVFFKTPVKARYVRIYPQSWHNWISMRAGLLICEKPCEHNRLDYDFSGIFASKTQGPSLDPSWGDGEFDDELGYRFGAGEGFELDASRCLKNPDSWTVIMRVRLDHVHGYRALLTSPDWGDGYGLYVDKYLQLAPRGANLICEDQLISRNKFYYFGMTRSKGGRITLFIDGAKCAAGDEVFQDHYHLDTSHITFLRDESGQDSAGYVQNILLWSKLLDEYEVAAECNCLLPQKSEERCDHVLEYSSVSKMTKYSSVMDDSPVGSGFARGRLNSRAGWQPKISAIGEWMQIDTGKVQIITGVVTQGYKGRGQWVTAYYVQVSNDGFEWKDVKCRWHWQGNKDENSKQRNTFEDAVLGRFVRIYPVEWHGAIGLRAGVIICMKPCEDGELYYEFGKQSLLSSTDGPALDTPWGSGFFTDEGYRFLAGEGFDVDENEELCMNNHRNLTFNSTNHAYTISMTAMFDSTTGWVRLVSTPGWGDDGLYINRKYKIFPPGANMKCKETIIPKRWYQFGITRTSDGVLSLYINGAKCATGSPGFSQGLTLDPHELTFFHDDGHENSAGSVKEIHIWNRALTELEMASYCGCQLNQVAPRCSKNIIFSAAYSKTKYSSVLQNSGPGIGYGRGRLNSPQAWIPQVRDGDEEFMQIDIGSVESLVGIVTQGRHDQDEWVTSFFVQVSTDEVKWVPVFCGEIFDANSNRNSKVSNVFRTPVFARFVRIIPKTWYGQAAMRAGVLLCEHKCISGTLEYKFDSSFLSDSNGPALDPAWGEGSFDDPTLGYRFGAGQGLTVDESTCLINPENITILMDVRLDITSGYRNLLTSDGWGDYGLYVNGQYQAYPTAADLKCNEVILPNKFYKYMFSRSHDGYVKLYLNGYLCAEGAPPFVEGYLPDPTSIQFLHSDGEWNSAGYLKKIKIWSRVLTSIEAAHESECQLAKLASPCNATVVLVPSYSRVRYSSTWSNSPVGGFCAIGRLGSPDGWCAASAVIGEYMQIDTGALQSIEGIVTQGRGTSWQWVTSFKVSVSIDGVHFTPVQCGSVFNANSDMDTKVENVFDHPVYGRYIRIFPQAWYNWISMRAAVLVCERPCASGRLDYEFLDDFLSSTDGPNLNSPWGFNTFEPNLGYHFYDGRGLELNEGTCINGQEDWTIYFEIRLDRTAGDQQRLLNSIGWDDSGLYVSERKYTIMPGVDVQCSEPLRPNVFYKFIMTRSRWGEVTLFINGYPCAVGSPPYASGFELNAHDIEFFHDSGNKNARGYVKRLQLWGRVLSEKEAALVSGCILHPPSKAICNSSFGYSPPYSFIKYSSVWINNPVGVGHGRGRLNSPQAWSSGFAREDEFMEIDIGEVSAINGIVTQGRHDYAQWVTLLKVTYSEDGKHWFSVQCGEAFEANSDTDTKVSIEFDNPVKGRYVRIWPIEWYNWISMRAGILLCERKCIGGALDYRFDDTFVSQTRGPALLPQWGEGFFDYRADKLGYRFEAAQGFSLDAGECLGTNDYTILIEAQFDNVQNWIRLLGTGVWGDFGLYVKEGKFMLFPRSSGLACEGSILPGFFYKFGISRTQEGRVQLYLNGYLCVEKSPSMVNHFALDPKDIIFLHDDGSDNAAGYARRIRLWSRDFSREQMAEINECVPAEEVSVCKSTVTYNPPYSHIVYSSTWNRDPVGYGHGRGRLDDVQAWSAVRLVRGEYMQIDTGSIQNIAGIVTQMRGDWAWQYVSAYSVAVSTDGSTWSDVQCGVPFEGNAPLSWNDKDVKKVNMFNRPVKGRYVQIIAQAWVGHISMRAGVILCEKPCVGGALDYSLSDDLMSTTDGPSMEPIGGFGSFTDDGYRYNAGQGLSLDQSTCISDSSAYTIIIAAKLDNTDTWNRLLFSKGWGRYGLFVQGGKFEFFPVDLGLVCPGKIQPQISYQFGITHTADAEVKLYLNGWRCASAMTFDAPNELKLTQDDIEFFRDPNNLNYYGYVNRIRIWGKVLDEKEMMEKMGCQLPEKAEKSCSSYVVRNVPYSQMRFDSVYGNYPAGQYYGQGRLNSQYGWLSPDYAQGHWIQLDLGQVQTVAGVVTQGMSWGWYTTSFAVKVSKDGRKWGSVECGRSFDGNTDWSTELRTLFEYTVTAQYVRIYPKTFIGYANMRAGALICEELCSSGLLDYDFDESFESSTNGPELSTTWGIGSFSEHGYNFGTGQGLEIANRATCIEDAGVYSVVINVRLCYNQWSSGILAPNWYALLTSESWGDSGLYVNGKFMLKPLSLSCAESIRYQYYYQFGITRGSDGTVTLYLNGYPCASGKPPFKNGYSLSKDMIFFRGINGQSLSGFVKRIRVWDTALTPAKLASESGCSLLTEVDKCNGLIVVNVPYDSIAASSVWGNAAIGSTWGQGQLNAQYSWIPNDWTVGKMWLQLDSGAVQKIAGIVTQGCGYYGYYNWFVSSFQIEVSEDGSTWTYAECGRIFDGNSDWNTKVNTVFAKPVKGRYVRIHPIEFNGYPSLRAGVLVCESECSNNELDYTMNAGFTSSTGGPSLKAKWGEGTFQAQGYKFGVGQGFTLDEDACITTQEEYSVLIRVKLDTVSGWRAVFTSETWGDSGIFVNNNMMLKGSSLACKNEPIRSDIWYTYGMVRSKTGSVTIYLNGYKCGQGSPKLNGGFKLAPHDMIFFHGINDQSSAGTVVRIHIWGKTLSDDDVRSQSDCSLPESSTDRCSSQVVLSVPYSQIKASTVYAGYKIEEGSYYGQARLNSPSSWLAYNYDQNQWLQLDAGSSKLIAGVVTQGSAVWYAWTTMYKVMVSTDGADWKYVECGRIFDANTDMNTKVKNVFDYPVKAQYVRICPQGWYNYVTMRAGLLLCESDCQNGALDFRFEDSFGSSTDGPSIEGQWGEGTFQHDRVRYSTGEYFNNIKFYRFSSGQGLRVKQGTCLTSKTIYSVLLEVWLETTTAWKVLMSADAWSHAGLFDNLNYVLKGSSLACPDKIRTAYFYKYGMTRDKDGLVTLFLNGYPCASGNY